MLTLVMAAQLVIASCPTPTFATQSPVTMPTPGSSRDFVATDFTNDGLDDLAIVMSTGNQGALVRLRSLGNGTFDMSGGPQSMVTGLAAPSTSIAVGYFNADAAPDFAIGSTSGIALWFTNVGGGIGPGGLLFPGYRISDVAVSDWDEDRRPDIVAAFGEPRVRVIKNLNTAGSFSEAFLLFDSDLLADPKIAVADLHGAGIPQIVSASFTQDWLAHTRSSPRILATYANPWSPTLGDADLDGNIDVIVPYPNDHTIRIWRGGYTPRFVGATFAIPGFLDEVPAIDLDAMTGVATMPYDTAVADVTGDGQLDLIVVDPLADALWILMGNGSGFSSVARFATGATPVGVLVGRFNADGAPDIAVLDESEGVRVFINTCFAPATNLAIVGMEVTQVIQNLTNDVRLVAGQRTFVRVHAVSSGAPATVTATLRGANGAGVPFERVLKPLNPGLVGLVDTRVARRHLTQGFVFELPPEWTAAGDLALTAEINPDHRTAEPRYSDNVRDDVVQFVTSPPVKIELVRFGYQSKFGEILPSDEDMARSESMLRRVLPAERFVVTTSTFHSATTFSWADNPETIFVGSAPDAIDVRDDFMRATAGTRRSGVLYLVMTGREHMGGVVDSIPGRVAVAGARGNGELITHELGHLMGRRHVACTGGEAIPDQSYPYPNGTIGGPDRANPAFVGLDHGDASLVPAVPTRSIWPELGTMGGGASTVVGDVMSYCQPKWPSDYTYTAIANAFDAIFPLADPRGDFLAVHGTIDGDEKTARFEATRVDQASFIPEREHGAFSLRLFGENNEVLADYPFTPSQRQEVIEELAFELIVDFVPGTRAVAVVGAHGESLGYLPVSASVPKLEAWAEGTLGAGPLTIHWQGDDADGDALTADALYSVDGGESWRVIAAGNEAKSFVVDDRDLASTLREKTGILRVRVRDSVHTRYVDVGSGLWTPGSPPRVRITSPFVDSRFAQGQTLMLAALASDSDDGTLPGSAVTWTSSRDGVLGRGATLAPLLSQGTHVITARATDRDGNTAVTSTTVHVSRFAPSAPPPKAIAIGPALARLGESLMVDGTKTRGNGEEPTRYYWELIAAPSVGLQGRPYLDQDAKGYAWFTPRLPGTYYVRLSASTSTGTTTSDVVIKVND